MSQQKMNFLAPEFPSSRIIVEELTKETIEAAIQYYAQKRDGYWLELHQFGDAVDISVFEKLKEDDIREGYDIMI